MRFRHLTSLPKWSLRIEGKTILERSVASILGEPSIQITEVIFVVQRGLGNLLEQMSFEEHKLSEIGRVIELGKTLNGQAMSVLHALEYLADGKKFLVWNGDSALTQGWASNLEIGSNWLLAAGLPGEVWSFIRGTNGDVLETAEKKRISELASLGLYGFQDKSVFRQALEAQLLNPGERYVAPLYNSVLDLGHQVTYSEIAARNFLSFGTPEQLAETCRIHGWRLPAEIDQS